MASLNEEEAFRLLVDLDLIIRRLQGYSLDALQVTIVISTAEAARQPSSEAIDALCEAKGKMATLSIRELIRERTGR